MDPHQPRLHQVQALENSRNLGPAARHVAVEAPPNPVAKAVTPRCRRGCTRTAQIAAPPLTAACRACIPGAVDVRHTTSPENTPPVVHQCPGTPQHAADLHVLTADRRASSVRFHGLPPRHLGASLDTGQQAPRQPARCERYSRESERDITEPWLDLSGVLLAFGAVVRADLRPGSCAAHGHPEPADTCADEGTFVRAARNSYPAIRALTLRKGSHAA